MESLAREKVDGRKLETKEQYKIELCRDYKDYKEMMLECFDASKLPSTEDKWFQDKVENCSVFMIYDGERPIAQAVYETREPNELYAHKHGYITGVYVREEAQGKGFGTKLVCKCISQGRAENQSLIALSVLRGNLPAEGLYTKLGFKPDGKTREDRGKTYDLWARKV